MPFLPARASSDRGCPPRRIRWLTFALASLLLPGGVASGIENVIPGDEEKGRFGEYISLIGDRDGDGVSDLVVGQPDAIVNGLPGVGKVRVYSSASHAVLLTVTGQDRGQLFGRGIAGIPDVNGDGVPDLVVGAPGVNVLPLFPPRSAPLAEVGRAQVISGATGATLAQADGLTPLERHGRGALSLGDVNGDGKPDFAVSSRRRVNGAGIGLGSVLVYSGASVAGGVLAPLYQLDGEDAAGGFGNTLTQIGDWDGDGVDDFAVSAFLANVTIPPAVEGEEPVTLQEAGTVYVFSGASGALLHRFDGTSATANFGAAMAPIDDIDGDGRRELLVGAPGTEVMGRGNGGQVMIISSLDRSVLWASDETFVRRGFRLGACVAAMGDQDGDGVPDLVAGAPGAVSDAGMVLGFSGATGERLLIMVGPGSGARLGESCLGMPSGGPVRSVLAAPRAKVGTLAEAGMVFLCAQDVDQDGAADCLDNCLGLPNPQQLDVDADGVGDDCDPCLDGDGDGFAETSAANQSCAADLCPGVFNTDQTDSDNDGYGDVCDNCRVIPNPAQKPEEACVQIGGRIKVGRRTPSQRNRFSADLAGAPFDASVLDQAVSAESTFTLFDENGATLFSRSMPAGMLRRARPRRVVYSVGSTLSTGIDRVTLTLTRKGRLKVVVRGHGALVASGPPRARLDLGLYHLAAAEPDRALKRGRKNRRRR